jgi:medium-chain acyl-[acyl-carrier-protein] hydrolase
LFTFPYAGGGAGTYRQWQSAMPEDIEVCPVHLPGRERRFRETPFVRVEPLIESFAAAMLPWLDRPFALFGHSMGAIIAYELARLLAPRPAASLLLRVFLSARAAPHLPSTEPILHNLPDDEFIAELRQLKGTPEALLDDREAMRVMMPLVRADFQLTETYVHRPGPPLRCGLSVFGGRDDVWVDEGMLQDWRAYTDGPFRLRMMQGDHFYINDAPDALLSAIRDDLLHAMRPGRDRPAPFQTVR